MGKLRDCKLREKSVRSKGRRMRSRISRLSTLGIRLLSWLTLRLVRKSWKVCKLKRRRLTILKEPRGWRRFPFLSYNLKSSRRKPRLSGRNKRRIGLKERKNVFEKKITEFNDLMADERKTRLERRKEERLEERRRKWMREREEEEQTKKDELAIKEREEREAREAIE